MDILASTGLRLSYTTPYDYIRPFFELFPWLTQLKKILPMIIDLAITIPKSASYKSEELFFGCFVAAVSIKNYVLSDFQQQVLSAHILNKESAQIISLFVES